MSDNISCCGRNCYECIHFPHDCLGCNEIKGRVFWLEFVDEVICPIFNCCINKKEFIDCGICAEHPCYRYFEEKSAVPDEVACIETEIETELQIIHPKWIDIKVS